MALSLPDAGLVESHFVQLLHACASAFAVGFVVFISQSVIRIVVQEIAEDLCAIDGVLQRVEDVVMPEDIDIEQWRHLLIGEQLCESKETAILQFDGVHLFLRPAFAGFPVH